MNAVSQELGPCPCTEFNDDAERLHSCKQVGTKLTRFGHLVGCECRSCLGRRNKRKGHAAQAKGHRALGGTGFTPHDEESRGGYDIKIQVEHKSGEQVPANFRRFLATDWFRRALGQADRARRVGDGSMPAVMIDGRWIVADAKRDQETPA